MVMTMMIGVQEIAPPCFHRTQVTFLVLLLMMGTMCVRVCVIVACNFSVYNSWCSSTDLQHCQSVDAKWSVADLFVFVS